MVESPIVRYVLAGILVVVVAVVTWASGRQGKTRGKHRGRHR